MNTLADERRVLLAALPYVIERADLDGPLSADDLREWFHDLRWKP